MTKIEEIAFKYAKGEYPTQQMFSLLDVISAMKEYAEYYAIKCLQLAAESVKTEQVMNIQQGYEPFAETRINKGSILNLKLPDHD